MGRRRLKKKSKEEKKWRRRNNSIFRKNNKGNPESWGEVHTGHPSLRKEKKKRKNISQLPTIKIKWREEKSLGKTKRECEKLCKKK